MNKRFISKLMSLVLAVVLMLSAASAKGENVYETFMDGDVYIDIMVTNDSVIALDNEKIDFNFGNVEDPSGDRVYCKADATYSLTNTSAEEVTVWLAKPEVMRVKEVLLTDEEAKGFDSKARLMVNDEEISGLIYSGEDVNSILSKSVYETRQETFNHYTYKSFLNEAVFAFADKQTDTEKDKYEEYLGAKRKSYYFESWEGEERLCAKVFKLTFAPAETKKVFISQDLKGMLKRQTRYSKEGGSYTYAYNEGGISSFYSVGELKYSFNTTEELPLIDADVARYLEDEVWTAKFETIPSNFTFSVGKPLSDQEILDINSSNGLGKIISKTSYIVGALLVLASFAIIGVTIYRRIKSGVEHKI